MSAYATTTRRINTSGLVYLTIRGGVVELLRSGGRGCRMAVHWQEDGRSVDVIERLARVPARPGVSETLSRPRQITAVDVEVEPHRLGAQPQVPVQIYVPDGANVVLDHTSAVTARRVALATLKGELADGQALSWQRSTVGASLLYLDNGAIVTPRSLADVDLSDGVEGGLYSVLDQGTLQPLESDDSTRGHVEGTFNALMGAPLQQSSGSIR